MASLEIDSRSFQKSFQKDDAEKIERIFAQVDSELNPTEREKSLNISSEY